MQFNEFKEKVRVCKNCFNALEKTYTDHLASTQQQQQQKTSENTETTTNNNNNLTSTSDVELTSSNKTSKFLSDHNQPIFLLSGIMKNITDSFGFTNSNNSSNNTTVTNTNTNTNTPSTNASTTTINTLETKESSGATNDDDEFDFDSFDEDDDDDSSDQLDTAAAAAASNNNQPPLESQTSIIRVPPPTPAKNGFAHSYSRLPETSTKSAILKTSSASSISIAAANKLKRFTTVKKQPQLAEYGYLAKIAIDQQEQQRNSVKWERSYFVLYDDLTVAVFSNHTV